MIHRLKKHKFLLFCFLTAGIILLFASRSSPLYPMNDWVDVNCFLTMGRSLLAGKVPYVDLYEQKGPVLYFIYAIIALLSPGSFFGVYVLEVITFGLFLYYSGKILHLYLGEGLFPYLAVALLGGWICVTYAFAYGGSVEEITLFMTAYGFYAALRACKEKRPLHFWEALTCGVFCGMLLWIKYTMLGVWLGLAAFLVIWYLGWGHRKKLLPAIGAFLAGIGIVTGVVAAYFLLAGGLKELWTVYFYNNIFLYPKEPELSRMQTIRDCLKSTLELNKEYTWLLWPGLTWALVTVIRDVKPLLLLTLGFAGMTLGTYWGGWNIPYYGLVFAAFPIFGLLLFGQILDLLRVEKGLKKCKLLNPALMAVYLTLALALTGNYVRANTKNAYLMEVKREDMPQYRFARIINQQENPSVLNYGFLDGGFYFAADVIPQCYYFCQLNVITPDTFSVPREFINAGKADFIVTRDRTLDMYPNIKVEMYQCVDQAQLYFEYRDRTYYLYKLKTPE